jgi:serine/threonine protein kinase
MHPEPEALAVRIRRQLGVEIPTGARSHHPPPKIPDHHLIARIGGGSYGDVWLAQGITGQYYAVKVVWRENFSSDRPYEREFSGIAQFEPISRSHPGVVNVLHVGRDDALGCFFYIMELADDLGRGRRTEDGAARAEVQNPEAYVPRTLRADLDQGGRLPVADVLALGGRLADAVGHLHRHGLVHRDVKPSNVIFVKGQAKLADIGLVTGLDEARSFVGTEGFIPPEGPGTVQADLFGLGRLLYEAATGKDRCEFPNLPSDLDQWPDRAAFLELNEIITRACAPEPAARHANAAALAGDLNLLLSGKSIRLAYGIERRLKRATMVTSLAALCALLTVGGVWFQRVQRQRAEARAAQQALLRQRAQQSEEVSRERLRASLLQQALALTASSEPNRRAQALSALHAAAEVRPGTDLRNAAVAALATPELRIVRRWNTARSDAWASRPDTALKRYLRCYNNGSLAVVRVHDRDKGPRMVAFSPDGHWLATGGPDGVRTLNLETHQVRPVPLKDSVKALSFSADSHALNVLSDRACLRCEFHSGSTSVDGQWEPRETTPLPSDLELELAEFDSAGNSWAGLGRTGSSAGWAWHIGAFGRADVRTYHRLTPGSEFPALSPDGRWLAWGNWRANDAYLLDTEKGGVPVRLAGRGSTMVAFSPNGRWIAASDSQSVRFYRTGQQQVVQSVPRTPAGALPAPLTFSHDSRLCAVTVSPNQVQLIDPDSGRELVNLQTPEPHLLGRIAFGPDDQRLAVASTDHHVLLWDLAKLRGKLRELGLDW